MVDHKDVLVAPVAFPDNEMNSASAPSVDEINYVTTQSTPLLPPSYGAGVANGEQPMYDTADPYTRFTASRYSQKPVEHADQAWDTDDAEAPLLGNTVGDVHTDDFSDLPPPPEYAPYRAKYKQKGKGVISRDAHINEDGEALYRFLLDHNSPPAMEIKVRGHHEETRWKTETHRNSDGTTREEQHSYTEEVVDFDFAVDVSQYVSSTCAAMYVVPDKKTGKQRTVRELCDVYVKEDSTLKELQMQKSVEWNYKELTQAILYAIRCQGYHYSVDITYPLQNHRVTVKSNSKVSELADNNWIRALLVITCLWIFIVPAYYIMRRKYGHNDLKSEWTMKISEEEWYRLHVHEVLGQVQHRRC